MVSQNACALELGTISPAHVLMCCCCKLPYHFPGASPVATGLDILQILSNEHTEALDMLKKMKESTNPEEMRILNDKVIIKLVQHSIVEETLVYPLITEKLPGGREATDQDKQEHHRLEELMRDLEKSNPTQPNFNEAVDALTEALKHHASKEDKEQFPALRKAVPDEVLHGIVMKAEVNCTSAVNVFDVQGTCNA
jgi:hemerythrin-like domain-containing protein